MLEQLRQYIARILYPYGALRTVLRGPARGIRYEVQQGLGFSYGLGLRTEELEFVAGKIQPGMTVYDLGAHRGELTLVCARCVGDEGHVCAFEPAKSVCESLRRNIAYNRFSNVETICKAASSTTGRTSFAFDEESPTRGKLVGIPHKNVDTQTLVDIETIALDDFVDEGYPSPDLIKIDVEGAGASVLRGAARLIEEKSPHVYMEMHGQAELDGLQDELMARDYVVENMQGKRVRRPKKYGVSYWCYK